MTKPLKKRPFECCVNLSAMRQTSSAGLRFFCTSICGLLAVSFAAMAGFAQQPNTGSTAKMPEDPKQLMLLAAQTNRLSGEGMKPWQLKASFTVYDANGSTSDQGKLEILWINDQQYKIVLVSPKFSKAYYGTKKGLLTSGQSNPEPTPLVWVANEFVWPTLPPEGLKDLKFERHDEDLGGTKLTCLTLKDTKLTTVGKFQTPTYCLDADLPVLRLGTHEGDLHRFLRNNIISFQGRYVPADITAVLAQKTDLKVHLEDLHELKTIEETAFRPPPDARPVTPRAIAAR
jgi:hypothetical protein